MAGRGDDQGKIRELREVDRAFRKAFGLLAAAYRSTAGVSRKALSDTIAPRAGQGNPSGIVDLENGAGWVHSGFAREAFRELHIPNADRFADAYDGLKSALDGRSEGFYRNQRRVD